PSRACQMPTMIIMRPANKIRPPAQPLVSSPARLVDGYCDGPCSVICGSLLCLILRRPSGQPRSRCRPHPRTRPGDWRAANSRAVTWTAAAGRSSSSPPALTAPPPGPPQGRARLPPCDLASTYGVGPGDRPGAAGPPAGRPCAFAGGCLRQRWGREMALEPPLVSTSLFKPAGGNQPPTTLWQAALRASPSAGLCLVELRGL